MILRLPTEHHLESLSLKAGCTGLSESTLVKMPHCWKSRVAAQSCYIVLFCLCSQQFLSHDFLVLTSTNKCLPQELLWVSNRPFDPQSTNVTRDF